MNIKQLYIAIIALLLSACSETEIDNGQQKGLMPVLFSAGNTEAAVTRATASYMPQDSRFVCSMFFHAGANDTNESAFYSDKLSPDVNMATAWLKINNATGNAVYWNKSYTTENISTDTYGFDTSANCFYWQNRLNHIFLALADYNKLSSDDATGTLKIYPDVDTQYKDQYMLAYDLTKGEKTVMSQQPDPIQAVTTMNPAGATPEANRVKLFFKHQFSQIQVNLKSSQDESANVTSSQIEKVELLGVAETAYVAYCIKPDGTVPATTSEPTDVDTPFSLFESKTIPTGYLKSYEGIAFGTLHGIRITWREGVDENSVKHVATYKALDDKHKNLASGTKYIYNMELRRSVIAQVTAVIKPWEMDDTVYKANGTIDK